TSEEGGTDRHPGRPRGQPDPEAGVARVQDVLREEHLRRRGGRHEQERRERRCHHEREAPAGEEVGDAVAHPALGRGGVALDRPRAQREGRERDGRERRGVDRSAAFTRPAAATTPPSAGPPMKPAYRAVSTQPFARRIPSGSTMAGTSENSAGVAMALNAPSSAASGRIVAAEPANARATATAASASDAATSRWRRSTRSASAPAGAASSAAGDHTAMKSAATVSPEPPMERRS